MKALESARAEVNRRRSALESAHAALEEAEKEAKGVLDSAKMKAQSITKLPRADIVIATRNLAQAEAIVQKQEEALFIALQIIKARIGASLGGEPIDLSNDPIE